MAHIEASRFANKQVANNNAITANEPRTKVSKSASLCRKCTPQKKNAYPLMMQLMREIKADVAKLQARGYYGDGFWSDGKRLADSVRMGGEGLRPSDFPEYICGVSSSCVHPLYLLSVRTLNFYAKGMPRRPAEDLDDRETVRQALSKVRPHIVLDVKQSTGKRQGEGIMWIWEIMG